MCEPVLGVAATPVAGAGAAVASAGFASVSGTIVTSCAAEPVMVTPESIVASGEDGDALGDAFVSSRGGNPG